MNKKKEISHYNYIGMHGALWSGDY